MELIINNDPSNTRERSSQSSTASTTSASSGSTEIKHPGWLLDLFQLFTLNYNAAWTDRLPNQELYDGMLALWHHKLKGLRPGVIREAGLKAIDQCTYPPSPKDFMEIAQTIMRNTRFEESTTKALEGSTSAPPSPLLAEYMRNNPPKADDPFKKIFAESHGEERGNRVLAEINKQLLGVKRKP